MFTRSGRTIAVATTLTLWVVACSPSAVEPEPTQSTLTTTSSVVTEVLPEGLGDAETTTYTATATTVDDVVEHDPVPGWDAFTSPNVGGPVTVDADGTAWVGTTAGLVAWDLEDAHEAFRIQDGLPDHDVSSVAFDGEGTIWIGTAHGLTTQNDEEWVTHNPTGQGADCRWMTIDKVGDVWCGAKEVGLYRFDGSGWQVVADVDRTAPTDAAVVVAGPDGAIWAGSTTGSVWRLEGATLVELAGSNVTGAVSTMAFAGDNVWVGTHGSGVYRYDGETWEQFTTSEGLHHDVVTSIAVGPDGAVWLSGGTGLDALTLSRFDGSAWRTVGSPGGVSNSTDVESLTLAVAEDGTVWAASNAGTLRLLPTWDGWDQLRVFGEGPHMDTVTWLAAGSGGEVWVGTPDRLSVYDGSEWEILGQSSGLGGRMVTGIATAPDGTTWVTTELGATAFRDGGSSRYTKDSGLPSNNATAVAVGSDGTVWVGTDEGLARFDGEDWSTPLSGFITAVAADPTGDVWAARVGEPNLVRLGSDELTVYSVAAMEPEDGEAITDVVAALAVAPDGTLWLTVTHDGDEPVGGVLRLRGKTWTPFTEADGIPRGGFGPGSVAVGADGAVWVVARPLDGVGGGVGVFSADEWTTELEGRVVGPIASIGSDVWLGMNGAAKRVPVT